MVSRALLCNLKLLEARSRRALMRSIHLPKLLSKRQQLSSKPSF